MRWQEGCNHNKIKSHNCWVGDSQTGEHLYHRSPPIAVKALSPTSGFPTWGSGNGRRNSSRTVFVTQILWIRNLRLSDVKNSYMVPWLEVGRARFSSSEYSDFFFFPQKILNNLRKRMNTFLCMLITFVLKLNFIVLIFGNRNLTRGQVSLLLKSRAFL